MFNICCSSKSSMEHVSEKDGMGERYIMIFVIDSYLEERSFMAYIIKCFSDFANVDQD